MIAFIKKYKAFVFGAIITTILTVILEYKKVILIDKNEYLTNILGFSFYWFLISIFLHKIQYLKRHLKTVKRIIGLLGFLVLILIFDSKANMPDNPVTILMFLVFYLAITFIIVPDFFNKYKIAILLSYGIVYGVFLYFRLFSESFELYRQQVKELFLLFLLPIPIFATIWGYQQWKWLQNLKSEKTKAELAMLQAQINPHFFFNTLNNLYALTIKHSEDAPGVILKLSDMMRYTIYEGKKNLVPIRDEIAYISNYIDLHTIRYKKSVHVAFNHEVDPNIKVSPLLFIILVENAFKHGVDSLSEDAYVKINLSQTEKEVLFVVENNFEPSQINGSKGIGLNNLKHRLNLLYEKNYTLTEEVKDATNYKVRLKIPFYA